MMKAAHKQEKTRQPRGEWAKNGARLAHKVGRLLLVLAVLWVNSDTHLRAQSASEYDVKATFLFNFARFVEWPAEVFPQKDTPIVIGVVGRDPFGHVLDTTAFGKYINGRRVLVQRFGPTQDWRACHLLFISKSEARQMSSLIERLNGASVLTISDADGFIESGGIIKLVVEDYQVRFVINSVAADRARLKLSSKLQHLGIGGKPTAGRNQ